MKLLVATPLALVVGLALLPAVLATGDSPPLASCAYGVDIDAVLATIRSLESGGNYSATASGSTASGAYQILDSSWNGHGGYSRAADAPPDVQDAFAHKHVEAILEQHGGDVSAVPVAWYIGHVPDEGSDEWDEIPQPDAGNKLTPREYQARWLDELAAIRDAEATGPDGSWAPCAGVTVAQTVAGWSLPGPTELIHENPAALSQPHHDYPAWDWTIRTGTPIYAVRGGTVVAIHDWPYNWWQQGCGNEGGSDCRTCGVGVTILDTDDVRWTYCHGSALTTSLHSEVEAGQQLLWSGNTGRSATPHLHLEIRTYGVQVCPQPLLKTLADGDVPNAMNLPSAGCSF